jgi:hypothetical protein
LAETNKQLTGWLTSVHLNPRELTDDERRQHDIPDTWTDERGETHRQEAWTASDAFYRHAQPLTSDDYVPLVVAIIRSRYTEDQVEAILNNYLTDPDGHATEFQQLQAWRKKAKSAAREYLAL